MYISNKHEFLNVSSCHKCNCFIDLQTRKIQPLLMRLDVSAMCRSSYQVAQLFLLKVAYDHVGLTAWGLLNINKPFVVTVSIEFRNFLNCILFGGA